MRLLKTKQNKTKQSKNKNKKKQKKTKQNKKKKKKGNENKKTIKDKQHKNIFLKHEHHQKPTIFFFRLHFFFLFRLLSSFLYPYYFFFLTLFFLKIRLFCDFLFLFNLIVKDRIDFSKQLRGRYFNFLGYILSGYCIYKIFMVKLIGEKRRKKEGEKKRGKKKILLVFDGVHVLKKYSYVVCL